MWIFWIEGTIHFWIHGILDFQILVTLDLWIVASMLLKDLLLLIAQGKVHVDMAAHFLERREN